MDIGCDGWRLASHLDVWIASRDHLITLCEIHTVHSILKRSHEPFSFETVSNRNRFGCQIEEETENFSEDRTDPIFRLR